MSAFHRYVPAILFILGFPVIGISQQRSGFQAEIEAGSVLSSQSATPFWLRTNQYGIVPNRAPSGLLQAAIRKQYAAPDSTHRRKVDWGFSVNPVLTYDATNRGKLLLVEANAKIRFKAIELYVGRRREVTGLGDTTLSSGFYAVSGNSLPIPKLQLSTIGYAPLHFTRDFLAVNAGFAHGWFNVPYIQGVRLHQKHLYLRFGKPASRLKIYAGVNHQVQWAGHADYLKQRPDIADANGYFPSDWSFYKYVVFSYTPKDWSNVPGYTYFDSYRVGNSVGSIDFGAELTLNRTRLLAYYQHAYEDVSGIVFLNMPDGLWGLSFAFTPEHPTAFRINRLLLEFLTTKNQTAPTFEVPGSKYQGGDNYYNHSQYTEGWSYFDRTIGTPFIAPRQDFDPSSVLYNGQFFSNNRVNMWYVGLQGSFRQTTFQLRTSYSRNYGTFREPPASYPTQFSALLSAQVPVTQWPKTALLLKLALDNGGLYTNAVGGYVGLKKSW
ncbi:capsule assembly Wzi family protein [Spirosoma koreense]